MSAIGLFDWDAPLSDEQRDVLLHKIADSVRRRGLQTPAVWFLEVHRPLAPLAGQFGIALSPFLGIFFGGGAFDLQRYTKLLQTPGTVDSLVRMIETDSPARAEEGTALR